MCEYQRINPDNLKDMPMCTVNNKLCTFCVLGNAKTYDEAKRREEKKYEKDSRI